MSITFGSCCSGIEAASVAFRPLGWRAAWFSEIEPFPCAVLAHHFPNVPNHGDMLSLQRRILTGEIEAPDLLCGGTPCQDFSVAGTRGSLDGARGNLTLTFCEIANAIDHVRAARNDEPAIVLWENVPGVLSTKDNAFGCFLGALAGSGCELRPPGGGRWADAGCVYGPKRAVAWRILDAQYFGLAQRRRRVFVVASARNGFDPAAILFERDGVRRDSAPSREARKGAAAGTLRSTNGGSDVDHARAEHLVPSLARCDTAGEAKRQDFETCTIIPVSAVAPTLQTNGKAEGSAAQQDAENGALVVHGTLGRNSGQENVLAFSCKDHGADAGEVSPTLRAMGHAGSHPNAGGQVAVFYAIKAGALRPNPNCGPGGVGVHAEHAYTLEARSEVQAVAFAFTQNSQSEARKIGGDGAIVGAIAAAPGVQQQQNYVAVSATRDVAQTITSNYGKQPDNSDTGRGPNLAMHGMSVRRLTPVECERLQGFQDNWTLVPHRGKPAADGPRYKAIGNSWAVPCVLWIGARIDAALGVWIKMRADMGEL